LPKPFGDDELLSAVAKALACSAEERRQCGEVAESRVRLAQLTPREFEVFRLVIGGLLNKEIAAELGIALRTTKTHRARVMQKMGVVSVAELVRRASRPRPMVSRYHRRGARNYRILGRSTGIIIQC
jgi:FixJ family two-component response regulator